MRDDGEASDAPQALPAPRWHHRRQFAIGFAAAALLLGGTYAFVGQDAGDKAVVVKVVAVAGLSAFSVIVGGAMALDREVRWVAFGILAAAVPVALRFPVFLL